MNKCIYIFMLAAVLSGCDKIQSEGLGERDVNNALGDAARNVGRSVIQLGMSDDIANALAACNQQAAGQIVFYDFDKSIGGPSGKSYTVEKSNVIRFNTKDGHICKTANGVVVSIY